MTSGLRTVRPGEVARARVPAVDPGVMAEAAAIVEEVRSEGEMAVRRHAERFGDLNPGQQIVFGPEELAAAEKEAGSETTALLRRMHAGVERFASAQRESLADFETGLPGGLGGHLVRPVRTVGAYAPGGRYPLISSVLMTVVPARVAGCGRVTVASPRPGAATLAAASVAGADALIGVGGAQGVAALAFGVFDAAADMVVGPGNPWVTAAKKYLYGEVGIDGLAGPSEIVVIADDSADPALVATDLLAQAEHDIHAMPVLIATDESIASRVGDEISNQLAGLPTAPTATAAIRNGFCVVADDIDEAAAVCNELAPEHVAIHTRDPGEAAALLDAFGSLFIGAWSAEVFADYGVGPNHVLPTGGSARFASGLSVLTFLRLPTWTIIHDPASLIADSAAMARGEGLEAHARAAEARRPDAAGRRRTPGSGDGSGTIGAEQP